MSYERYMERAEAMTRAAAKAGDESMRRSFTLLAQEWRRLAMAALESPDPPSTPAQDQPRR